MVDDGFTDVTGREWREPRHPLGGYIFLGPHRKIYTYPARWRTVHEDGTISSHDEILKKVMLLFHPFYISLLGAEDINNIPVVVGVEAIIGCVNPVRFVFRVRDPYEARNAILVPVLTRFVRGRRWEDLTTEDVQRELWRYVSGTDIPVQDPDGTNRMVDLPTYLREEAGLLLRVISIKHVDPPREFQELATRRVTAVKEAEVVAIAATAEAGRIETLAGAEARKITVIGSAEAGRISAMAAAIAQHGPAGQLARLAVAVEARSDLGAATAVHLIPGLQEFLYQALGTNGANLTLDQVRQMIQEALQQVGGGHNTP
ncbi:MAG: hypothetical protein ABIF89_01705 [bacterium]